MTDIEKKALALLNECGWGGAHLKRAWNPRYEALCRAIEQHEAFKRDVSEFALGVKGYMASVKAMAWQSDCDELILPKPDPLVDALLETFPRANGAEGMAADLRAAIKARGGRIVWEGE